MLEYYKVSKRPRVGPIGNHRGRRREAIRCEGYGVISETDAVFVAKIKAPPPFYVVRRRRFQLAIILKDEQSMFRFPSGIVPSKETNNPFW